jgi:hypothetical protein
MRYVVASLSDGLGNQLFQYAAAKSLAFRTHRRLLVCNAHTRFVGRPYGLAPVVRDEQLLKHPSHRRLRWWIQSRTARLPRNLAKVLRLRYGVHTANDQHDGPDLQTLSENGIAVLYGYWQHERYFRDIRQSLADELRRAFQITPHDASGNSVCVHVRRGDYVNHGLMALTPLRFFQEAMAEMRSRLASPRFTIFSDDPAWCAAHFGHFGDVVPPAPVRAGDPAPDPLVDFKKMAGFSHFIISNSTYSWWAAYLGTHPGKIVIAPAQWFRERERSSEDPVLPGWVRI